MVSEKLYDNVQLKPSQLPWTQYHIKPSEESRKLPLKIKTKISKSKIFQRNKCWAKFGVGIPSSLTRGDNHLHAVINWLRFSFIVVVVINSSNTISVIIVLLSVGFTPVNWGDEHLSVTCAPAQRSSNHPKQQSGKLQSVLNCHFVKTIINQDLWSNQNRSSLTSYFRYGISKIEI